MAYEPLDTPVSYRRYLLFKRTAWRDMDNSAMQGVWRQKQEEQPGTPLPTTFPFLSELATGGYTTREDLDGATVPELQRIARLGMMDAETVLTAYAALPPL